MEKNKQSEMKRKGKEDATIIHYCKSKLPENGGNKRFSAIPTEVCWTYFWNKKHSSMLHW